MDRVKVTIDQLDDIMGGGDYADTIRDGLERWAELKEEEERVKQEIKDLNAELLPIMVMHDIGMVSSSMGSISWVEGENVSLNRDKLVNSMLKQGWDAADIAAVMEEGTTRTPYTTIMYKRPPKVKGS